MKNFDLWVRFCQEPIYADKGVYNIDKRKEIIYDFCRYGIIPFLATEGYVLEVNAEQLCIRILKVLWALRNKQIVIPLQQNFEDYHEEHQRVYNDTLDHHAWATFWRSWSDIQDFETPYGILFKYKLPELLWSWMDLPNCSKSDIIEQYLYEDEIQEQLAKRRDDPYVVDNSQIDYQDRHKH